jgi:hypothetical protein
MDFPDSTLAEDSYEYRNLSIPLLYDISPESALKRVLDKADKSFYGGLDFGLVPKGLMIRCMVRINSLIGIRLMDVNTILSWWTIM